MDPSLLLEAQRSWWRALEAGEEAASAAAREAWRRCRESLEVLSRNLEGVGYPCTAIVTPPAPDLHRHLASIERTVGAPLPPNLVAFWGIVGGLSLVDTDSYEHVNFWQDQGVEGPAGYCDGLYVDACTADWVDFVCEDFVEWREHEGRLAEPFVLSLSPDGYHKDDISGGVAYGMGLEPSWATAWRNFVWSGARRPTTAPADPPDLLSYVRTALLECAGFPALLGVPEFEPLRKRLLAGVPVF